MTEIEGKKKSNKVSSPLRRFLQTFSIAAVSFVIFYVIFKYLLFFGYITDDYMSPTLHKGDTVFYLSSKFTYPKRGDIISYSIKSKPNKSIYARVIGVPNDIIELKNGFVYLNNKLLQEAYTLKPRSTWVYESSVLGKNCQKITIPKDKFFVLTDVREGGITGSMWNGLVDLKDIRGIRIFSSNYSRDTSDDKDLIDKSNLDIKDYIKVINEKRNENNLTELVSDTDSNKVANYLLEDMIERKYYSYQEDKTNKALDSAFTQFNIKSSSVITFADRGFYDPQGLLDLYLNEPAHKESLLDNKYFSVGLASKVININNCPDQVNVTLLFAK
jgi:signal peptidase I